MSALYAVELRDLARLNGLAREIQRQTTYLRLNMVDHDTHDRLRFGLIGLHARHLVQVVERCERRAAKIRGG
jgi:hypothetical protein